MKYKVNIIDNLFSNESVPEWLIPAIHEVIMTSLVRGDNNEYSEELVALMKSRKSKERVRRELKEKYFVYITEEGSNNLIGFASIIKKKTHFYYTWLQVMPKYRHMGFAQKLSNIRDEYMRKKQHV